MTDFDIRIRALFNRKVYTPEKKDGEQEYRIIADKAYDTVFADQNMKYFVSAFTHPSVEYNDNLNYEKVELLGDKIVAVLACYRLYRLYHMYGYAELSNMFAYYTSNVIGYDIFKDKIGMEKYIISNEQITFEEDADVFESLIGTLYKVIENEYPGCGYSSCNNFYESMFSGYKYDDRYLHGAPKTKVTQMFQGLTKSTIIELPDKNSEFIGFVKLIIPDKIVTILLENPKDVVKKEIKTEFIQSASNHQQAALQAYQEMLIYFEETLGVTPEWSEELRRIQYLRDSKIEEKKITKKFEEYRKVKKDLDFVSWKIKKSKGEGEKKWRFIGIREDGSGKVLAWITGAMASDKHHIAKDEMLKDFVEGKYDTYNINPKTYYKEFKTKIDYVAKFTEELKNIFSKSYIPDIILDALFNEEYIKIFQAAFSNPSVEYNDSENYEKLKLLGSKIISMILGKILDQKFPDATHAELSNIFGFYTSNEINTSLFHDNIKMAKFIRYRELLNENEIEDKSSLFEEEANVFEAMIGALFITSEKIFDGMGIICCNNFYRVMSKNVKYDNKYLEGAPKTQVLQMFQGLAADNINIIETPKKGDIYEGYVRLEIPDEIMNLFDITLNKTIYEKRAPTKPEASKDVYTELLKDLKENDITPEWSANVRKEKFLRDSGVTSEQIDKKLKELKNLDPELNFKDWKLKKSSGEGKKHWRLIGFKPNRKNKLDGTILAWVTDKQQSVSKNTMLKDFIAGSYDKYIVEDLNKKMKK